VYDKKQPAALIYAKIHPETIRFLDSLSNRLDLFINYNPGIRPEDWRNKRNYGEDSKTGLKKIEDDNFIIYFKDTNIEASRAEKILKQANEAIPDLAGLMGKYPYPADVNDRKLPVYLAESQDEYRRIAIILGGSPKNNYNSTLGLYFSSYSRMGNLTAGILLNPKIWRNDSYAEQVLRHEMNHYVYFTLIEYDKTVRPYMWVYEGLAEYFSKEKAFSLTNNQILQCKQYSLSSTFPDYISNYWAGESVFRFMEYAYEKEYVKAFIRNTYSSTIEQSSSSTFDKNLYRIESEWKQWLEKK
jgi:hypothetical protein